MREWHCDYRDEIRLSFFSFLSLCNNDEDDENGNVPFQMQEKVSDAGSLVHNLSTLSPGATMDDLNQSQSHY